jgi:predicted alpha/beta superfamily hydrolase
MKKIIIYLVCILTGAITTALTIAYLSEEESYEGELKIKLYSEVLREERELLIHLPDQYDSTKKYPVFYVLDGGSLDRKLDQTLDVLTQAHYAHEAILVGIPNMTAENRTNNLVPPFMRTDPDDALSSFGNGDAFLSFIENEVKALIEKKYNCNGHNTLVGNSRGGLLTLYSIIKNPTSYQARLIFSAPVWRQDGMLIDKIISFIQTNGSPKGLIFISVGEQETDRMKMGFENLKKQIEKGDSSNINWKFMVTKHAKHETNASQSLPIALKYWSQSLGRH